MWMRGRGPALAGWFLAAVGFTALAQQAPKHGGDGTPEAWKFSWPVGNPVSGREVFVKLECYTCHEVKGEAFPVPEAGPDPGRVGPELSGMAPLHPPEYFAEAIINPNALVEEGKGYHAADGKSKMPSYNDLVTVQEVIDLVAYLKGLKGDGSPGPSGGHEGSGGQLPSSGGMARH